MILREIKLLVAVVSLVALAATVGLASTMHPHASSAQQAQGAGSKASPSGKNGSPRHGILTCGAGSTATACEQLEMMLPMSVIRWAEPLKLPTNI
jgi:hypothetical protein